MASPLLSAIYRYPVKSMAGGRFDCLAIGARGPLHDREWMLVDDSGRFLTLRQLPRMALISTELDGDGQLMLRAPEMSDVVVGDANGPRVDVKVWGDTVQAQRADPAVDAWCTEFLRRPCRLVRMPADTVRVVSPEYATPDDQVGFADGFPFLLISQASLDDLSRRVGETLSMRRFRPNLVVSGCEPYAEDGWQRLRIGEITFRVAKPCSRCIVPTIDPDSAERSPEPLRTLMTYRRRDKQVFFGQNLLHDRPGELSVGMPVELLD